MRVDYVMIVIFKHENYAHMINKKNSRYVWMEDGNNNWIIHYYNHLIISNIISNDQRYQIMYKLAQNIRFNILLFKFKRKKNMKTRYFTIYSDVALFKFDQK